VAPAMRSPVNWSLLGLVIQRPSYGYELVQRFERTYDGTLQLSSPSQIYSALDLLERRGLVELLPALDSQESSRQPKPHYRVTATGRTAYVDWLVSHIDGEQRRSRLFAHQIAVLPPADALEVVERCERECLKAATAASHATESGGVSTRGLTTHLIDEERRRLLDARLAWIEYARRHLRSLISAEKASANNEPA
jgi:DNA-binding PadR family transcriptional regulator